MTRLGVAAAVVGGEIVAGDVGIEDGRIAAVGLSPPGARGTAAAGFVDLQVNGFAGVDFLGTDVEGFERAGRALAATGVSAYQPTFISSSAADYERALGVMVSLPERPGGVRVLGCHLEGPFLSRKWPGAHNPDNIVPPDLTLARRLCDSGPVTYMTLAPEEPGGLDLIDYLSGRGIVVSLGHCDADAATARRAYDRGAATITHIYNAQRRWQPRDPGVAGVALTRPGVVVQAICDFVHVAREAIHAAWLATRGRFAIVTDAMMAAGMGDGDYVLGDRLVHVRSGEARLGDGTLAGSVATMDAMIRNLISLGVPLPDALATATTVPARLVGSPELGDLEPGSAADVVVLSDDLTVTRTVVAGAEVYAA